MRSERLFGTARTAAWLLVVLAVFVGAMPRIAGYDEAWRHLANMKLLSLAVLVGAAAWNLVTYWFVLVAALPGLRLIQAAVVNQASTAVANALPAGAAWGVGVTYSMYRGWGFRKEAIARSVVVTGIWNTLVKLAMPALALPLMLVAEQQDDALLPLALAGVVILGTLVLVAGSGLRSPATARRVGRWAGELVSFLRRLVGASPVEGWDEEAVRFRDDAIGLVEQRWRALTVASLVSHVSLYLVLLAALRATGVPGSALGWSEVLLAFALVRLVLIVPVTPGGAGLTELSLTGALIAAGGDRVDVVAAVLVFRALTWLVPILLGIPVYLLWRRRQHIGPEVQWVR